MTESFPHFRPSTQHDERLKSVEKHFLNSHISVESEKCDKREASDDEEETFRFESKSEENSEQSGVKRCGSADRRHSCRCAGSRAESRRKFQSQSSVH